MTSSGLTAIGVVKKYKHFQLGPIDLHLEPGSATGLLGANGAGKTTLLNCLAGQMRPDGGEIRWMGEEISLKNWRVRDHIGFVTEYPSLYENLTARDHLLFVSNIFSNWDHEFAATWLERFQLPPGQKIREYSKGMKVKLSILIAISHRADLLLLDEPTSGLDPDTRFEIQGHLRELVASKDVCLLLSSHLFEDIENAAADVKIISGGKIIHEFPLEDLDDYVYAESSGLEDPLDSDTMEHPDLIPVFTWRKGSGNCLLFRKGDAPQLKDSKRFTGLRKARLEDIYFGTQAAQQKINKK